jgi:hypothetical protein
MNLGAKKKPARFRASLGGAIWLLMSMFKVDPPPPPQTEDLSKTRDEVPGAPPRPPRLRDPGGEPS